MKVVPLLVTALAASAGCGSDPFTVVVRADPVSLLAYRDGGGEWHPIDATDPVRTRIEITEGRYSLAWMCGSFSMNVIHSTLADEPYLDCGGGVFDGGGTSLLTGMTVPRAQVYAGTFNGRDGVTADTSGFYAIAVDAGVHDVIAVTTDDRIYVARDVDLWSDRELALPVDTLGVAMEVRMPEVRGAQQRISLSTKLVTSHRDVATILGTDTMVRVPPASVLAATDVVVVQVDGVDSGCDVQTRLGDGTPKLVIPDPPDPDIGHGRLTWDSDVDWDAVHLDVSGSKASYTVDASRDWMSEAGTDAVELPDLTQLPGWQPGFGSFEQNDSVNYTLDVSRGRLDEDRSSCTIDRAGNW